MSPSLSVKFYKFGILLLLPFLLCLWVPGEVHAQRLPFRVYSIKEGLPQSQISGIVQDKSGYLWLATADGLTSFDGYRFIHYTKKDGLAGSLINKIYLDSKGTLWLGHRASGLTRYEVSEKRFKVIEFPGGIGKAEIKDITETSDGSLYFATLKHGLFRYRNNQWQQYVKVKDQALGNLRALCTDGEQLWVGGDQGLFVFDPRQAEEKRISAVTGPADRPALAVTGLVLDLNKNLWICTAGQGTFILENSRQDSSGQIPVIRYQSEIPPFTAQCALRDHSGRLWFGSKELGIIRYNPHEQNKAGKSYTIINHANGLPREDITAIYEDREGSFWFGTNGAGVYQYRGRSLEQYGKREGLPDEVVWAVYEDTTGTFWFGSESGLTRILNIDAQIENWQIRRWASPKRRGSGSIIDIAEGFQGELWVVIHRNGVRVFNPSSGRYRKVPGLDEDKIICIEKGTDQDLWFGTFYNGVYRFEYRTGKITNYRDSDGLGSNTVFDILRTKNGHIWFATNETGLTRFNGHTFEIYGQSKGLGPTSVLTLAEDSKGRIWIGSEGEGLHLYDGESFINYSQKYGIWNEDIYSVICDKDNNVFIGTRRGIEKIDPENNRVKKYGGLEGYSAIETNQNAVYRDSKGHIWFGTINGVVRYNPEEEKKNILPPITTINRIRINQQDLPLPEDARYSYDDNHFTFHFSGLSFVAPEKIRYSYKLEGIDPEWSPPIEDRNATYANLAPGSYVFRVKSANSDGVWSQNPASYTFSITSPFWKSYWFYFMVIALIGSAIYGTHHLRVRKISQNNQILEEMVRARTTDLINEKEKAQKAYDALRESEEKLIQVTSSIDAYLWSLSLTEDQELAGTFITDTFFHMVGVEKSEFLSEEKKAEQFLEYVHPDDQNLVREAYKSALQGTTVNVSFRLINRDGKERWHYNHAFPVKDKEDHVFLIHGVGFDVTNQKLAELALRKSEEKYATFMRFSTEAIWCIDLKEPIDTTLAVENQVDLIFRNAFISDSNDAMANLYGYESATEISGLPLSEGLLSENEEHRKLLKKFIQGGYRLKNAEFSELDRNGKMRIMLIGFVGIIENNFLVRSWGTQRDITLQKEAEQVLRESEEMYRRLIERSPDAIIVHSGGIIDYINQAGVKMYGGERVDQFIGRELTDFAHPQFKELGRQRIEQIYTQKKEVSLMEQKMTRLDGSEFDVEVTGAPIIYKGKASGQSIVRDITERKKIEAELQKAQKLESIGLLAGGIAHDFNNILTAILGNISMGKLYSPPGSEALTMLTQAEKATLQAKDLTQQLLTFSKGGAPVKETTSIFEMVKESASFVLRGSNIDAAYECEEDLWSAEIDAAQMSQVIQNLIINAEQAMPDGKRITIKLNNITLNAYAQPGLKAGKYVQISIVDTGIGIPEEHIHKVFDPYFTTKQKGSGLGLATSYSIIRKHEGHISIHSEIGKGTNVRIYLPASEKAAAVPVHQTQPLSNGKGKILVMDDEDMLRELTQQLLTHLGYQVETVPDGEQAIQTYREALSAGDPFSLVIMDLTIPGGMGGKETIEELRKIDSDVQAIVSSGYSNDPVLSDFKRFGFSAVLPKPYKIETLSAIISQALDDHQPA